jgi:moderate conductance mechanosensitive channel
MTVLESYFSRLNQYQWSHQLIRISLVLLVTVVAVLLFQALISRFHKYIEKGIKNEEALKRATTLTRVLKSCGYVLILAVAAMLILSELRIDIKPIIAAAGIGGIALGLGAQNLVKDYIAGFFLLLEDQVRVGDVIKIGDASGVVEDIRLRVLMLRDLSGNLHIIPHGSINMVTNLTHTYSYYLFDYSVAYNQEVDQVIAVVRDTAEDLRKDPAFAEDILEPAEIMGLDRFEGASVVIRGRIKTKPIRQWRVGRELNLRIKKRFGELGISIPFPGPNPPLANLPEFLLKSSTNPNGGTK